MKKSFTIISSLIMITFLTHAYMPPHDILNNPKAIDWHMQQKAYFAKIQVAHADIGKSSRFNQSKKWI